MTGPLKEELKAPRKRILGGNKHSNETVEREERRMRDQGQIEQDYVIGKASMGRHLSSMIPSNIHFFFLLSVFSFFF